jgi:ribosomal protein L29
MKARTIRMSKVRKAIAEAYGVNREQALELVPMFIKAA